MPEDRVGIGRRDFIKGGAAVVGGAIVGGVVGRVTASSEGAPSISPDPIKHLEQFPGLDFNPVKIGGEPLAGTLANGRKGYWFHAENGQRVEILAEENDEPSYIKTDLYDARGNIVAPNMDTRIETSIFDKGDYFLVVDKNGYAPSERNRFTLAIKDDLEQGIKTGFIRNPSSTSPEYRRARLVRLEEEMLPIFENGDVAIVLDFNNEVFDERGLLIGDQKISAYAVRGGPETLGGPGARATLPEDNRRQNLIPIHMEPFGRDRVIIRGYDSKGPASFPDGSHIAIIVENPKAPGLIPFSEVTRPLWTMRFFTLSTPNRQPGNVSPAKTYDKAKG